MNTRWWLRRGLVLTTLLCVNSCRTVQFYSQAIGGQLDMMSRRRPVEQVMADPATSERLRSRLRLIQEMRSFARQRLLLPDDAYDSYADLGRPSAVYVVFAAPELSLEPKEWWYPVVGSLRYRGFFSADEAKTCVAEVKAQGYETIAAGVDAYSTLGWFRDPILNTFVHDDEGALAELLFHELTHRKLFISGDTEFNEALATAVGQHGARLWLKSRGQSRDLQDYERALRREKEFIALTTKTREELKALYASPLGEDEKRRQKERLLSSLQGAHQKMKRRWQLESAEGPFFDAWFRKGLNNARFVPLETYYDLVPALELRLRAHHGNMEAFFREMEALRPLSDKERRRRLESQGGRSLELSD